METGIFEYACSQMGLEEAIKDADAAADQSGTPRFVVKCQCSSRTISPGIFYCGPLSESVRQQSYPNGHMVYVASPGASPAERMQVARQAVIKEQAL